MYHFYAFLARMKNIKRWGLMRNVQDENIQEHSLLVAQLAHALAVIQNRYFGGQVDAERVCTLAVFHDASEVITGDLATPIKYFNPEIRKAYKEIEKVAGQKLLMMLPPELTDTYRPLIVEEAVEADQALYPYVKAADKLSAYIKCIEETKAGNGEFAKAEKAIRQQLEEMHLPALDYFMAHFLESFLLTLDELN